MLLALLAQLCLLSPGLLAATTPKPHSSVTDPLRIIAPNDLPYHCLQQSPTIGHIFQRPDKSDCAHALDQILKADKAEAPMLISHTEGFLVPHRWEYGTCAIYIDTDDAVAHKPVMLALSGVIRIGLIIMDHCIDEGPGLGGTALLGSWDDSGGVLNVVVVGKHDPIVDMPPIIQVAQAMGMKGQA